MGQPLAWTDGPEKPVRIWSRIGRRPLLAFGNSNGDIPMLAFAGGWTVVSINDDWRVVFAGTAP